jgi:hypothetical protein
MLGLQIPAHSEALRVGGEFFLTEAFRASGALAADNRIVEITRLEEWPGGSTGRKVLLSVAYENPAPGLHTELFVKFSRDFSDAKPGQPGSPISRRGFRSCCRRILPARPLSRGSRTR